MRSFRYAVLSAVLAFLQLSTIAHAQSSTVSREIAPGVLHKHIVSEGPFSIHVLELTLRNRTWSLVSYRAEGLVPTSEQAQSATLGGGAVLAAINADFFSFETGWPVGNQVENGKFVVGLRSGRSHLLISRTGAPLFGRVSFSGSVRTRTGTVLPLGGVNIPLGGRGIGVFTSHHGVVSDSARSNVALVLLSQAWLAGDTLRFWVSDKNARGPMDIPPAGLVLSTTGDQAVGLEDQFNIGDTVAVFLGFEPSYQGIIQAVGGAGRILRDGAYDPDENLGDERLKKAFLENRHPRTFVGIDRDTTTLFLCTVDGRQEASAGMSFEEMASFLLSVGAWDAINLDGGGSTTMVVNGEVVNSPSDVKGERAVANSLMVIQTH